MVVDRKLLTIFKAQNYIPDDPAGLVYSLDGLVIRIDPLDLSATKILHD
jgi:hypothetical protein